MMNNYCKLFLVRDVKYLFLLVAVFFLSAGNGYAQLESARNIALQRNVVQQEQVAGQKEISVNISKRSFSDALREISRKADIGISFNSGIFPSYKVSLRLYHVSVFKAVDQLLKGTDLKADLSKSRDVLIISKKPKIHTVKVQPSNNVSGTVTDSTSGETLPGVNILIKGTHTGGTTDLNGEYDLTVPSRQDTLVFSYIGYTQKVVPIRGRSTIDVSLVSKALTGENLVVVGYGKQQEISVVGAQSSIDSTDLLKSPSGSLTNSLAGRLSGVVGVQRSGLPGSDASDLWIRGISTFGASGPLILVDGIERPMNSLNPDDIKSLTILKDASATAIYGTRGANGVILIETKRGHQGSPNFSLDYYQGVTTLTQSPDLVDGPTYMRLANEASTTRGGNQRYTDEEIQKTANHNQPLLYPDVDWVDQIFNDFGKNRQLNASIDGGNDVAQYRVSLSWYNEKGYLPNVDSTSYNTNSLYNKYNLSSNVTVNVTPTTKANLGVGGYLTDKKYPNQSVGAIYGQALQVNPVIYPVIYPGGRVPGRNSNGGNRNPYADATTRGYSDNFLSQLFTNIDIRQQLDMITPGLSVHGLFGFDTNNDNTVNRTKRLNTYYVNPNNPYDVDGSYYYNLTYEGSNTLSYSNNDNNGSRKFYIQGDVNYDRNFDKHHITGLLHYSQSDDQNSFAGSVISSLPHREQSFAGRATYSYDNRYFLEVNAGYTGSENFAPSNRYGFFPSAGVGWVLSNEKFWKSAFLDNIFQYFKVRYSDGYVGASSNPGRRFAFLTNFNEGAGGFAYGLNNGYGRGGIDISDIGVDIQWAVSRKQDLGFDVRMLNNNLSFTLDFFKEDRDKIFLRRRSLPNFVGLTSDPLGNFGEVVNRGIDGQVNYSNNVTKDFYFGLEGNFTYNKDEIIDNDQPPQPQPYLNHRGDNLLADYGYIAEGLFKDQEEINDHAQQFGTVLPGDIKYKDLNGDGQINGFDVAKIGRGDVPYLTVGTTVSFRYKAFDLRGFFQGQFGADRQIGGYGIQPFYGDGGKGNVYAAALDHWTVDDPDPDAAYPRLGYGAVPNTNNYKTSSFWERRINFVRVRLVEFGYTLPFSFSKTKIRNARIYFRGRNLFTFSNFDLWDPELNTGNGSNYPNNKVFSLGLNVKF